MPQRVVVVGGGLSGLTVARTLLHRAAPGSVTVTVLEATARLGGNLVTERHGDLQIDGGPDGWVAAKPEAAALCRALGLGEDLIETVAHNRRVYVAHRGRLEPVPEGVVLGVPTRLGPALRSPLLSLRGKARLALDLVLPPSPPPPRDVSLGDLVGRRLGREVVEALTEPLLAGVYAGDAWTLSARQTFPQLLAMAARDPSLLRAAALAAPQRHPGAAPPSAFVSLRRGTGSLIDALAAALPDGVVHTATPARALRRRPTDADTRWTVDTDAGPLDADHVVLGLPTHAAGRLVAGVDARAAAALSAIPYGSAATVFFAFPRDAVPHRLDATGFVVPHREGMEILASTWVTSKWPGRAPDDTVLLRVFVGGTAHADHMGRSDDDLVALARRNLSRLLPISAAPSFTRVYRFHQTSPQPTVGHASRVAAIAEAMAPHAGLYPIGSAYQGVGISDVVRLAESTAARILAD